MPFEATKQTFREKPIRAWGTVALEALAVITNTALASKDHLSIYLAAYLNGYRDILHDACRGKGCAPPERGEATWDPTDYFDHIQNRSNQAGTAFYALFQATLPPAYFAAGYYMGKLLLPRLNWWQKASILSAIVGVTFGLNCGFLGMAYANGYDDATTYVFTADEDGSSKDYRAFVNIPRSAHLKAGTHCQAHQTLISQLLALLNRYLHLSVSS